MSSVISEIVSSVERELARIYAFDPQADAMNHILTRPELRASLGSFAMSQPEFNAPGGVWLLPTTSNEEIFIGVHFDEEISHAFERRDPRVALNNDNLEPYCIVVEEISHFHMILNRAQAGLEVTKLELECQGEIDKLLLSGLLLEQQSGHSHVLALAHKLYDLAEITSPNKELYREATKYAARFWYDHAKDETLKLESSILRERLRNLYRAGLADKLNIISDTSKVA